MKMGMKYLKIAYFLTSRLFSFQYLFLMPRNLDLILFILST